MKNNLNQQAIKGTYWIVLERFGQQGITFFVSILLARMLDPSEFGLIAMIAIFMAFSSHLINGGFASSLIQKKDTTQTDESTVFWFNLGISGFMTLILWLLAPWIADFYEQPRLIAITQWSSFNLLLTGLAVVQMALLQKKFLFRLRMIASVSAIIASGIVSVSMALKGFGVWALVVGGLTTNFVMISMVWVLHPWRPSMEFSLSSFRTLFGFGSRLLGASLMTAIYENIYQLIIGKVYTATDLGFFVQAKRFVMLCSYMPVAVITQVHFPYMCEIQHDRDQMRHVFSKTLKLSVMVTLPMLVGLAVTAPNLISVLVGEKWLPSVPYLRIMCGTGILYVIYMLNLDIIKALGHSGLLLRIEIFKRIILVVSIVLLLRFGIEALLYGELFCSLVATMTTSNLMKRYLEAGLSCQFSWIFPFIAVAGVMGVIVGVVDTFQISLLKKFLLQIVIGSSTYAILLLIIRNNEFIELIKICRSRISKV